MVYACADLVGWGTRGGGGVPDLLFKTSYLLNLHSKTINPNPWGGGVTFNLNFTVHFLTFNSIFYVVP